MLPSAVPRGDAPKGVRLERHPDVEVPKFVDVESSHYDLESQLVQLDSIFLGFAPKIEPKRRLIYIMLFLF